MLLAFIFLQEKINLWGMIGIVLITIGTFMMIEKKGHKRRAEREKKSLVAICNRIRCICKPYFYPWKIGISGVESNLGTAIRTGVVLIMAWIMVMITGKMRTIKKISKKELAFIVLSGLATGSSWLCYYKALQDGPASVVVPIDKLSILVTVIFSYVVFHEKLSLKADVGLFLIVAGTLVMLIP